ncbi:hypothetical protein ACOMHN_066980 [Nucella lapillus]
MAAKPHFNDAERRVVQLGRLNRWDSMKESMIGAAHRRVKLGTAAQDAILADAMEKEKFDVIMDLVNANFQFAPWTLDKVMQQAVKDNNLNLMEKLVLLSKNPYQFDKSLLADVMARFCSEDDWLPQAYELANRLPSDSDLVELQGKINAPLSQRKQVMNILNRLRIRFEYNSDDDAPQPSQEAGEA